MMMRALGIAAIAASPLQAQVTDPQPRCSLLVMLQTTQHHYACSQGNDVLRQGLQDALNLYATYFVRNSDISLDDISEAIRVVALTPVPQPYDCNGPGEIPVFHDAMLIDPTRVLRTAQQHLAVDQPVDLDFDTHCFGDEVN